MRNKIGALFAEHRRLTFLIIAGLVIVAYVAWRWATEPDRRLYGLDTATGRILWTASLPAVKRPLSPAAAQQRSAPTRSQWIGGGLVIQFGSATR